MNCKEKEKRVNLDNSSVWIRIGGIVKPLDILQTGLITALLLNFDHIGINSGTNRNRRREVYEKSKKTTEKGRVQN